MAEVTEAISQPADLLLGACLDAWQSLPLIETEIDRWDLIDQLSFIENWPPQEQRLAILERYAAEGNLSSDQMDRLEHLKRVVERNRPIIRRLQAS